MANAGDNLRWAYAQLARAGIATATEHSYEARTQHEVFAKLAAQPDCAMRVRAYEIGTHAVLGEYDQPMAIRKNISGIFISNSNLYWNIKKN